MNVVHWSDANRGLAEECGAAGPILTIMETVDDESVLVQARSGKPFVLHAISYLFRGLFEILHGFLSLLQESIDAAE